MDQHLHELGQTLLAHRLAWRDEGHVDAGSAIADDDVADDGLVGVSQTIRGLADMSLDHLRGLHLLGLQDSRPANAIHALTRSATAALCHLNWLLLPDDSSTRVDRARCIWVTEYHWAKQYHQACIEAGLDVDRHRQVLAGMAAAPRGTNASKPGEHHLAVTVGREMEDRGVLGASRLGLLFQLTSASVHGLQWAIWERPDSRHFDTGQPGVHEYEHHVSPKEFAQMFRLLLRVSDFALERWLTLSRNFSG